MKIEVIRDIFTSTETFGKMFIDGEFFCYTLEDVLRDVKIKHKTAIPSGRYEVIYNLSPKFKKNMPRLLNVPGFQGILIHGGCTHEDSSGCILVAFHRNEAKGFIWGSASNKLNDLIEKSTSMIEILIINNQGGYNAQQN